MIKWLSNKGVIGTLECNKAANTSVVSGFI